MTELLLDPRSLPGFSALTPEAAAAALDVALAGYRQCAERLVAETPVSFDAVWLPLERAQTAIDALWSAVTHLNSVRSDDALRAVHAAGEVRLVEIGTAINQNRAVYDLLRSLEGAPEFERRTAADRAAVRHMIRACELSGVALEPAARARFAEISAELAGLSSDFANAVKDSTDAWAELVTDPTLLAGIPEATLDMFAGAARDRGEVAGWLITLQMPSVNGILTFAENRDLRHRVYTAYGTRASAAGPGGSCFDNGSRIERILALRREAAQLLGYASPVERSLATKMAKSPDAVLTFLRDLASRARPAAAQELKELSAFADETMGLSDLEPWDIPFVATRMRLARYGVDEAALREYFPVDRVLTGWQALLARLFGIRLVERDDVEVWHSNARYYDVLGEDGSCFAGLYVDLHARAGKQGGAWMADARPRLDDDGGHTHPVAYLVCNFPPPGEDRPSLLSHREVITLLHETGHCLHHLFTAVDRPSVSGPRGFEWDAVELPSQLMEDFAWDLRVLAPMSGHWRTGESLPETLFEKVAAARRFQSGLALVRQIEFALFDLLLHLEAPGADPMTVLDAARAETAVVAMPAWHRFPHSFTHIFAGGYAAGYYSYLWAELLSADAFELFSDAGLLDRTVGERLRDEILSRGASRTAAESFRAFRSRDPDASAMLRRHGLLADD